MHIARTVLPAFNQWHSQCPPKLFQPRLVPCDPLTNSLAEAAAMSVPQTQQPTVTMGNPQLQQLPSPVWPS